VDVGGTFTDIICVTPEGEIVLDKTPTTLDDQSTGVMNGLTQLSERFGLSLTELCGRLDILVHGTTTADNTMIEMNGAATGLLVTEGHRDEIEFRRCTRKRSGIRRPRDLCQSRVDGHGSRSPSESTSKATSCVRSTKTPCAAESGDSRRSACGRSR